MLMRTKETYSKQVYLERISGEEVVKSVVAKKQRDLTKLEQEPAAGNVIQR
jgi:hypothetical protein